MNPDMCTTWDAKRYVKELLGDEELRAPGATAGKLGKPYFHFFLGLSNVGAEFEFTQLAQLPIQDRERDLIERMNVDGWIW